MVVIAYLGWAAYGATTILFPVHPSPFSTVISGVALVALGISWTLFAIQKHPLTFYVYAVFPCYFWRVALVASVGPLLELHRSGKLQGGIKVLLRVVFVIAALQSMVVRVLIFSHPCRNEEPPLTSTNRSDTPIGSSGASDSSSSGSFGQPGAGQNES